MINCKFYSNLELQLLFGMIVKAKQKFQANDQQSGRDTFRRMFSQMQKQIFFQLRHNFQLLHYFYYNSNVELILQQNPPRSRMGTEKNMQKHKGNPPPPRAPLSYLLRLAAKS